jgi:hypothetical protein
LWEYLFVDFFSYGGELRARRVDGIILDDWEHGMVMHDYANQAGRDGWELVAVNVGDSSAQLVFKRTKGPSVPSPSGRGLG